MIKIIFLTLFAFIHSLYQVSIPVETYFFQKKNNNKYSLFSKGKFYSLDVEYDNVVLVEEKKYDFE